MSNMSAYTCFLKTGQLCCYHHDINVSWTHIYGCRLLDAYKKVLWHIEYNVNL